MEKAYQRFKESKFTEFLYRFILWFSIGFLIVLLASKASGSEGTVFSQLIHKDTKFPDTMGVFGLIFACFSLFFKDLLGLNIIGNYIFKEASSLLGKVSSDLVLVAFGAISLLLGSLFYYYTENVYTPNQIKSIIMMTPVLFIYLASLAFISYIVRLNETSTVWEKRKKLPQGIRFPLYLIAPVLMLYLLWYK